MSESSHSDFYKTLREKVASWSRTKKGRENPFLSIALLAPDLFHLLIKLSLDKDVPWPLKTKLAIGIAYFVSPVDLIPDFIPVAGFLDDVVVAAFILNELLNKIDVSIVERNWAGDGDVITAVRDIISKADEMIGSGLLKTLLNFVGVKKPKSK